MGTVSGHQLSTFSSPVNGTSPIDANTVRGNDNTIKTAYNAHDADVTIHLQSGAVASRPSASTANQTWLATDSGAVYLYLDTGSAWVEANYLRNTGGTVSGAVTFNGGATVASGQTLTLTGATVAGAPTWSATQSLNTAGNAGTATALQNARTLWGQPFDGTANISGGLSSVSAIAMSGTLTMSAAASKIVPGATSFSHRNNADTADNLLITDAGAVTVRSTLTASGAIAVNGGTFAASAIYSDAVNGLQIGARAGSSNEFILFNSAGQSVMRTAAGATRDVVFSSNITVSGALKIGNAYVAGAPAATGYVTLSDSTGTTYKVLVST